MISRSARSATPRPAWSRIKGRLLPPAPELSWRTRRDTRLTRTFGLTTFAKACLHSSLFKDTLHLKFTEPGRLLGWPAKGKRKNAKRIKPKYSSMKAVILAAGKGTRMGELTNEQPKPMLRVAGQPILEHILEGLLAAGIREIFI